MQRFVGTVEQWSAEFLGRQLKGLPLNSLIQWNYGGMGGVQGQFYYRGAFSLAPGECLLLDAPAPAKSRYWNVQLTDDLFMSMDYAAFQCSLNDHQASVDEDGRFRAVIAATDPGVPNWLDTAGHRRGTILGRWLDADRAEVPSLRLVKLDELRNHLPRSTPVISPAERDRLIRARQEAAELRRLW